MLMNGASKLVILNGHLKKYILLLAYQKHQLFSMKEQTLINQNYRLFCFNRAKFPVQNVLLLLARYCLLSLFTKNLEHECFIFYYEYVPRSKYNASKNTSLEKNSCQIYYHVNFSVLVFFKVFNMLYH